jgi:hypothetical protein
MACWQNSRSVVDAVRCAAEIQRGMIDREPEVPDERCIRFRIGINLGELVFLLYQKGRDSRIFQAQDRAIDDFTLKGISAQHINRSVSYELMI